MTKSYNVTKIGVVEQLADHFSKSKSDLGEVEYNIPTAAEAAALPL